MIKLLLADDSVTIQRVVELTFSGEDVQVIAVSDGEQAIVRLPIERPDIVLADIGMPKRDGYEVSAFVKGHPDLSHIPVLLMAGAFEPVDENRAREVKADGVLVKPFEPQQVIARVRELVGLKPAGSVVAPPKAAAPPPPAPPAPAPPKLELPPAVKRAPEPAPAAEPQFQPQAATEGLDDYFDRLDAAFATLGSGAPGAGADGLGDPFADRDVPTVDDVLSDATLRLPPPAPMEFGRVILPPIEPPDMSPTLTAAPRPSSTAALAPSAPVNGPTAIADVFRVLFAAERGDTEAVLRLQSAPPAPIITDDFVDEVARRVLERLAPDTARQLVADIVSEVAERLVREEIIRIKNMSTDV